MGLFISKTISASFALVILHFQSVRVCGQIVITEEGFDAAAGYSCYFKCLTTLSERSTEKDLSVKE